MNSFVVPAISQRCAYGRPPGLLSQPLLPSKCQQSGFLLICFVIVKTPIQVLLKFLGLSYISLWGTYTFMRLWCDEHDS